MHACSLNFNSSERSEVRYHSIDTALLDMDESNNPMLDRYVHCFENRTRWSSVTDREVMPWFASAIFVIIGPRASSRV
jgi:hypothetical protein